MASRRHRSHKQPVSFSLPVFLQPPTYVTVIFVEGLPDSESVIVAELLVVHAALVNWYNNVPSIRVSLIYVSSTQSSDVRLE